MEPDKATDGKGLNATQAQILQLSAEIVAFVKERSADSDVISAALEIASKIVWRPLQT